MSADLPYGEGAAMLSQKNGKMTTCLATVLNHWQLILMTLSLSENKSWLFYSLIQFFQNWFPKILKLLDMDAAIFDFQYIESYILYFTILQLKIMVQFNIDNENLNMLMPIPCRWKTRTKWFKGVDN